jgi:hypothetical protein
MSRQSIARVLVFLSAALLTWSTVASAEAKPRRYAEEVMADWTICRNGAELEIGSPSDRVRLIATSFRSSGEQRVLADKTVVLPLRPLTVWVEWPIPDQDSNEVIDDTPAEQPQFNTPDPAVSDHSAIVKVWWSAEAGSTIRLALGPASEPSPLAANFRVRDCKFRRKRSGHGRALKSWWWTPSWLAARG